MNIKSILVVVSFMLALVFTSSCSVSYEDTPATSNNDSGGGASSSGSGVILGNPKITIVNNTGYTIGSSGTTSGSGIYIKPSTAALSWGNNLVRSFPYLSDGESREFTLSQPLSTHSVYDIRVNSSEFSFRKYGVTISNGMTITFTASDLNDGSAQPSITLQNRSGKAFNSVHIKPSAISGWGESFGTVSNNSDLSATILVPPSNYTVFDIQARSTNPTNTYTKNNVTISQDMILTFTSADADNQTIELPVIVIQNNTGYTIGSSGTTSGSGIYIKPSTSTNWGNNLVRSYPYLSDGESRAFTLSQNLSAQNAYDIRLNGGGFNFTKNNVIVSEGMILTFTTSDAE